LKLSEGSVPLQAVPVGKNKKLIVLATNEGRLLIFDLKEVPDLAKGKGQKLINIPPAKFSSGEEQVVGVALLSGKQGLLVQAGKRKLTLKPKDLDNYLSERSKRGLKLPRGVKKITAIEAIER